MSLPIYGVQHLANQISEAAAGLLDVASPLSEEQFNWRPAEGRWSVGECLEHVALTNESYTRKFQRLGARGTLPSGVGPWKGSLVGRIFLWMMEPPPRGRVKAPAAFLPSASRLEKAATLRRFEGSRDALLAVLATFEGVDLGRARVASPAARWLRFDLASAFGILAAHERRHLWQARRIPGEPGYPR